jgi:glycosyltransferase involved in cell wall biosynthesis
MSVRLNLLIVTRERQGDEIFGLGRAIRRIRDELIALGHDVSILDARSWTDQDHARELRIQRKLLWITQRLGLSPNPIPALAERIIQVLRAKSLLKTSSGFTHIWLQDSLISVAYDWFGRTNTKAKRIVSVHGLGSGAQSANLDGLEIDERWIRLLLCAERRSLKRASLVLLPSEAARTQLVRDLGLACAPKHWHVLRHGRPDFVLMGRDDARRVLGINNATPIILAIGRITPVKRYDLILSAVIFLQKLHPRLQLVILGGTPTPNLSHLIAQINPKPIFVASGDTPTYLAAADFYISACAAESYGMANVEAICAKIPSVIAAGGASPEIIEHGALLCAPTARALFETTHLLLSDQALLQRVSELAALRCANLPTWADVAKQHIRLLTEY